MTTTQNTNVYPTDFVARVKEAYPNEKRLHVLLDVNSYLVGKYLDVMGISSISAAAVIYAMDNGPDAMFNLRKTAEQELKRKSLYAEWRNITHSG